MNPQDYYQLFQDLVTALHKAFKKHISHNDLKPENINDKDFKISDLMGGFIKYELMEN